MLHSRCCVALKEAGDNECMGTGGYADVVVSGLEKIDPQFEVIHLDDLVTQTATHPFFCVMATSPNKNAKTVLLSAGVHGDEPAGVHALVRFLQCRIGDYLSHFSFVVLPCANPAGFDAGIRDNAEGANLNCCFLSPTPPKEVVLIKKFLAQLQSKYLFAVDLHEDNTFAPDSLGLKQRYIPRGFYLYENCFQFRRLIGNQVTKYLRRKKIRVSRMPFIYNEPCDDGVVKTGGLFDPKYTDGDTLEGHAQKYTPHAFTAETPTYWGLEERIDTHLVVLSKMLDAFRDRALASEQKKVIIT